MNKIASTQQNIPIAGMKDGVTILNDGQYRIIMEVSAVNFALKSEQEQNSLIFQYQSFLNSLHFPIQIVVQSKKLDLSPYVNKIKKLTKDQKNDLLKIQTRDYADFITQLIDIANIMKKRFFVIVGYQPISMKTGIFDKFFSKEKKITTLKIPEEEFNHYTKEIRQRATSVAQNLGSMGLHCKQLSTQEMIEEFYSVYNPELAGKERLADIENLSSSVVSSKKNEINETDQSKKDEKTIDNQAIVQAKQKKKQNEISREKYKDAERQASKPENAQASKEANAQQKPEITTESPTYVTQNESVIDDNKETSQTQLEKKIKDPNTNRNFEW